jgi:uncharacterized protein involved in response to NO
LLLPMAHAARMTRIIIQNKNKRNYIVIGIMAALIVANLLMILDFASLIDDLSFFAGEWASLFDGLAQVGAIFSANAIMVIIALIGGRVTPNFTRSYLLQSASIKDREAAANIRQFPLVEKLSIGLLVLHALLELFISQGSSYDWLISSVALTAGLVHLFRLSLWASLTSYKNPLVWILHLGYSWLVLALLIKGLSPWLALPHHLYLHALTMGAIGSYLLGMMSRAALGHTGRPLVIKPIITLAYLLVSVAAFVRVAIVFHLDFFMLGMVLSFGLWVTAFLLYLWVYTPILIRPRID